MRRLSLAEKLRKIPLSFFGKKDLSDLTTVLMADCATLEGGLSHWGPEFAGSVVSTILIAVGIFIFDWRMAPLSVVTVPAGMAFMMSVLGNYGRDYEGAVRKTQEMNGTMSLANALMCIVMPFLVFWQMKLFGMMAMLRLASASIDRTLQTEEMEQTDEKGRNFGGRNLYGPLAQLVAVMLLFFIARASTGWNEIYEA